MGFWTAKVEGVYTKSFDMSETQRTAMLFIIEWVRDKKTPVPRERLMKYMEKQGVGRFTTNAVVKSLVSKRYIRRGSVPSRAVVYIQLRGL